MTRALRPRETFCQGGRQLTKLHGPSKDSSRPATRHASCAVNINELVSDRSERFGAVLKEHRGLAADDADLLWSDLRERDRGFFGQPVRQVITVRNASKIAERKHCEFDRYGVSDKPGPDGQCR